MGIFDALTTAVSGLQAQSFALQNISGNIANSQTIGYKETDTAFQDLVSTAALGQQTAGGVFAGSVASNGVQGTIQNETVSTDMAIDGNGWFVVAQPSGSAGGGTQQSFSGINYFTRRGDFQVNQNGYLVNGAGYYLEGIPLNPATGAATSSSPQVLQFNNSFLPAQATTQISYQANLPSTPSSQPFVAGGYTVDPTAAGTGTVEGQDASMFAAQSLDGGSITTYDSEGNAVNVQMRWAETATSGTGNTWQLFYQANSTATGTQVAWQNTGTSFTFNNSGQLTSPTATTLALPNLTVNGDVVGNVTLNYGSGGLTQFATTTGNVRWPPSIRMASPPARCSRSRSMVRVRSSALSRTAKPSLWPMSRWRRSAARIRWSRSTAKPTPPRPIPARRSTRRPARSSAVRSRLRTSISPPSSAN